MMLDASVPEAIRRCKRMEILVAIGFLPVLFAPGLLSVYGFQAFRPIGLWYLLLPLPYALWFVAWRGVRRTLRRAAAADHLLCPECLYDLRTLDATGPCPECGRPYDHAAVRAQWQDAQERLKRRPWARPAPPPAAALGSRHPAPGGQHRDEAPR
jgi:hypothetical protein